LPSLSFHSLPSFLFFFHFLHSFQLFPRSQRMETPQFDPFSPWKVRPFLSHPLNPARLRPGHVPCPPPNDAIFRLFFSCRIARILAFFVGVRDVAVFSSLSEGHILRDFVTKVYGPISIHTPSGSPPPLNHWRAAYVSWALPDGS